MASLATFFVLNIKKGDDNLQLVDGSFLSDDTTGNVTEQMYFSDFSPVTSCQFDVNFAWFDYSDMNNSTQPGFYQSELTNLTLQAFFNYCTKLDATNLTACNGDYYAAIKSSSQCLLQADTLSQTTNGTNLALVYSNLNASTNGNITQLTVTFVCAPDQLEPQASPLYIDSLSERTYKTELSSAANCPVFTYNKFCQTLFEWSWLFAALFIVVGLLLAIFGQPLFKYLVGLLAFLLTTSLALLLCYATFWQATGSSAT